MKGYLLGVNASWSASATNYSSIHNTTGVTATESTVEVPVPMAFTASNLYVYTATAPGSAASGKAIDYFLVKNGSATSLDAQLFETAVTASDTSHSVSFAAGDTLSLGATPTATPTIGFGSWKIDTDATNAYPVFATYGTNLSTTTTQYMAPQNGGNQSTAISTTENLIAMIWPSTGTISNLYAKLTVAPGLAASGKSRTFTIMKNGVAQTLTTQVLETATTSSDTTHSFSVTAGDLISIRCEVASTPAAGIAGLGFQFSPTNDGEGLWTMNTTNNVVSTTTFNIPYSQGRSAFNTTESNSNSKFPFTLTVKGYYFYASTAPGVGKTFVSTMRQSAADTAHLVTLTDTATTGNVITDVTYTAGNNITVKSSSTGSPTTSGSYHISLLTYWPPDLSVNKSDSITITESVSVAVTGGSTDLSVNVSDNVTITENVIEMVESNVNVSDSPTISENLVRLVENFVNVSDSPTITESVQRMAENRVSVSDSSTITESSKVELNSFVNKSDSVTITESNKVEGNNFINVSDSSTITESLTELIPTLFIGVNDIATISESSSVSIAVSGTATVNVSDNVTITEANTLLEASFVNVSDTPTITESVQRLLESNINVSDSATITESTQRQLDETINVSDNPTITESLKLLAENRINVSDSATITESSNVSIVVIGTDSINVSDSVTVSENVSLLIPTLPLAVSDTATITENIQLLVESNVNKSDSVTITENTLRMAENYINKSDNLTITENNVQLIPTLFINKNDQITITEAVTAQQAGTLATNKTESITITENVSVVTAIGNTATTGSDSLENITPIPGTIVIGQTNTDSGESITGTGGTTVTGGDGDSLENFSPPAGITLIGGSSDSIES